MPLPLKKLATDLKKFGRDPKDYPRLGVKGLESKLFVGTKAIMFRGTVLGETDKYPVLIQFFGLNVGTEKSDKTPVAAKVEKNLWYHSKPSISQNPISIKCGCQDFRFTFEYPLHKNKSLIGNYRKYTPVAGSNRPPRNPKDLLGYCKHIYSMLAALKDSKRIED